MGGCSASSRVPTLPAIILARDAQSNVTADARPCGPLPSSWAMAIRAVRAISLRTFRQLPFQVAIEVDLASSRSRGRWSTSLMSKTPVVATKTLDHRNLKLMSTQQHLLRVVLFIDYVGVEESSTEQAKQHLFLSSRNW